MWIADCIIKNASGGENKSNFYTFELIFYKDQNTDIALFHMKTQIVRFMTIKCKLKVFLLSKLSFNLTRIKDANI